MFKTCSRCKERKTLSSFNWKIKGIKRAYHCKQCSRKYIKKHYLDNREYYLKKASKRNRKIKDKANRYVGKYLQTHPCVDCGETDILVLEFDHRDRSGKEEAVNRIIRNTGRMDKLVREISKCDVRCANCHRRKTEKENNSWRLKYAPVA